MDPLKPYQVHFRIPASGRAWMSKRFDTLADAEAHIAARFAALPVGTQASIRCLEPANEPATDASR